MVFANSANENMTMRTYEYHKQGTRQAERDRMKDIILKKYGLPLIRFATNGSNEKKTLMDKLHELQG